MRGAEVDGGTCALTRPARPWAPGSGSLVPAHAPAIPTPDPVSYSPPHRPAAPRAPAAWPCSLAAARGGPRTAPHHPLRRSRDSERLLGGKRQPEDRPERANGTPAPRCERRAFRVKAENHVTTNAAVTSDPARNGGAAGTELLQAGRRGERWAVFILLIGKGMGTRSCLKCITRIRGLQ